MVVSILFLNIPNLQRIFKLEEEPSKEWKVTAGVLPYEGRIYVPKDDIH
jgi:hypothetical protein